MRAISCTTEILARTDLLAGGDVEHVAFFLAQPLNDHLRLVDVRAMDAADFDGRSAEHAILADSVRPELIA